MNSIHTDYGTYSGSLEDVLDRHDPLNKNNPPNYPCWSDAKWKSIFHLHNKALKTMEKQKEGEKIQGEKIAKENLTETLRAISKLKQSRKEEQKKIAEKYKLSCDLHMFRKSGNTKGMMKKTGDVVDFLRVQEDDILLWYWNLMRVSHKAIKHKKIKKDTEGLLNAITPLVIERRLPCSGAALTVAISGISRERLQYFKTYLQLK